MVNFRRDTLVVYCRAVYIYMHTYIYTYLYIHTYISYKYYAHIYTNQTLTETQFPVNWHPEIGLQISLILRRIFMDTTYFNCIKGDCAEQKMLKDNT